MRLFQSIAMLGLVLITAACGTYQTRTINNSGFLRDYSQLRSGKRGEAQGVYINPNARISDYKSIYIDPVVIWAEPDSSVMKTTSHEELQALANYFYAELREQLQGDYQIVNRPGAGSLRLHAALTQAGPSNVALDVVSSVIPVSLALSAVKQVAVGTHSFVGQASAEAELLDGGTGERLMAAVDARAPRKLAFGIKFGRWKQAQAACDYWAAQIRNRLADQRAANR